MNRKLSKIIKIAILSALASVVMFFLKFPIFAPPVNFLEVDFSNVFSLLGGFMFGPLTAVAIEFFKILLYMLYNGFASKTFYIGELSNLIYSVAFVLPVTTLYHFKKGKKTVLIGLLCSVLFVCAAAVITGHYIIYPMYVKRFGEFLSFTLAWKFALTYVLGFNAIKYSASAIIVFLLYKRVKFLFKW